MAFTKEERKELKEKYKEQRRSMWDREATTKHRTRGEVGKSIGRFGQR